MMGMLRKFSVILAFFALLGCSVSDQSGGVEEPPNIIFILVDDMGWADVGYHGSHIATPNIDALAASGVEIDRGYAFPICSPTRAALMTGRNPLQYGIDGPMENDAMLQADLTLMPEYLHDAGYQTWMVGKWHLGMGSEEAMPNARGFDSFYGHLGGFIDFYTHVYFGGLDWQRDGVTVREEGHATDLLTTEATRLISNYDGAAPFFMYLSYNAPHTPLQYPPGAKDTYPEIEDPDQRVYAQMMTHLDTSIGIVLDQLAESGLSENTIVVFMSDNGGMLMAGASNGELRGGKGSAFEGGVRVPSIIRWPAVLEPSKLGDTPLFVQDWLPTLLDAAGVSYEAQLFDGISTWAAITGQGDVRRDAPVIIGTANMKAVYDWPFKLVRSPAPEGGEVSDELYNVADDPFEQNNIAASEAALTARLAALLNALPVRPSKGARGPPPESLFVGPDGRFIHDIRLPETREPWADTASRAINAERTGS